MVNPCFFLSKTLALLADPSEVGPGGGDIRRLSPLELAVVIIVLGLAICLAAWAKHLSTQMGEDSTRCRGDPESETLKSHK